MECCKNVMVNVIQDMLIGLYGEEAAKAMMAPKPKRTDLPISPRENLKLVLDHKKPMYMPTNGDMVSILPDVLLERTHYSGTDWFGVEWEYVPNVGAPMVKPGTEMFDDVTNWKNKIKFPNLDTVDWAKSAKEMEPFYDPDKMTSFWVMIGPFERLHSCMGIEQAFMALYDEPETVHEFFEYVTEHKIKLLGKLIDHYKVDIFLFHDDWGSAQNGFFSIPMFEEFIYPYMKRIVQYVKSRGVYFDMHSCGKVESYIPYMVDMGCDMWNPAQSLNDLAKIKALYGDKIVISGGMDDYFLDSPTITEEQLRQYVRNKVDSLAPGGGFIPKPGSRILKNNGIMMDELLKYSADFYK